MYLSRDPFARAELHKQQVTRKGHLETCDWCGQGDRPLYVYRTEHDGGRRHHHKGHFCSKSCHDSYHGGV